MFSPVCSDTECSSDNVITAVDSLRNSITGIIAVVITADPHSKHQDSISCATLNPV